MKKTDPKAMTKEELYAEVMKEKAMKRKYVATYQEKLKAAGVKRINLTAPAHLEARIRAFAEQLIREDKEDKTKDKRHIPTDEPIVKSDEPIVKSDPVQFIVNTQLRSGR
jgi:hypothetical protein